MTLARKPLLVFFAPSILISEMETGSVEFSSI
jgi:hypothetical protein